MSDAHELEAIDWTDCPLVESVPGKVSGVPILKGTRVQADSILENYEGGSPIDEISDNFSIQEDTLRAVLDYAAKQDRKRKESLEQVFAKVRGLFEDDDLGFSRDHSPDRPVDLS